MFPKRAAETDFPQYYKLRCDDSNIFWTGYKSAPQKDRLFAWYLENISKDDRYFFLFFLDKECTDAAGYLYMDFLKSVPDVIEVGYGVYKGLGGKGYGTQINKFAIDYTAKNLYQIRHLQAWIASDNIASLQCVLKNGYCKTDETKDVQFGDGEIKKFEKYLYDIKRP